MNRHRALWLIVSGRTRAMTSHLGIELMGHPDVWMGLASKEVFDFLDNYVAADVGDGFG